MKPVKSFASESQWQAFARKFRSEMSTPEAGRTLDLLAALSHSAHFSVGCYLESESQSQACARKCRSEMSTPEAGRTLDLLAALSHSAHFSVGCYCEDESRCHRSILRQLLTERGADIAK